MRRKIGTQKIKCSEVFLIDACLEQKIFWKWNARSGNDFGRAFKLAYSIRIKQNEFAFANNIIHQIEFNRNFSGRDQQDKVIVGTKRIKKWNFLLFILCKYIWSPSTCLVPDNLEKIEKVWCELLGRCSVFHSSSLTLVYLFLQSHWRKPQFFILRYSTLMT